MFEDIFRYKRVVAEKLLSYGFKEVDSAFEFSKEVLDSEFLLIVTIDASGNVSTRLIEQATNEEYALYKTAAAGNFVGEVREVIQEVLQDIADKCYESAIYKQTQTIEMLNYAKSTYGDTPEFLWDKFPNFGVLRRADSDKWYAIFMVIPKNKLGIPSDEVVEIINMKTEKDKMSSLMEKDNFYPGWHMNKKSWYSVILDNSVSDEELCKLMEESYSLAK